MPDTEPLAPQTPPSETQPPVLPPPASPSPVHTFVKKTWKNALIIGGIILILVGSIFVIRLFLGGSEDSWVCVEGQWVKHGNPAVPQPTEKCAPTLEKPVPTQPAVVPAQDDPNFVRYLSSTLAKCPSQIIPKIAANVPEKRTPAVLAETFAKKWLAYFTGSTVCPEAAALDTRIEVLGIDHGASSTVIRTNFEAELFYGIKPTTSTRDFWIQPGDDVWPDGWVGNKEVNFRMVLENGYYNIENVVAPNYKVKPRYHSSTSE
ncbi:MAG TPA: hypothetical protein VMC43_03050 [Candidatus Paceibacterota bacterium]|nr:hypothetical protein [Candidatus Paceibacterota bacterium]